MQPLQSPARFPPRAQAASAVALLTVGISVGISFIEAPAKFSTPSLAYPVALDVGRHVFQASEWVQLVLLALIYALSRRSGWRARGWLTLASMALVAQRFVLFPLLEARALVYLAGGTPPSSGAHWAYVGVEFVKLGALLSFAWFAARPHGSVS